jgi:hypothetical protein
MIAEMKKLVDFRISQAHRGGDSAIPCGSRSVLLVHRDVGERPLAWKLAVRH